MSTPRREPLDPVTPETTEAFRRDQARGRALMFASTPLFVGSVVALFTVGQTPLVIGGLCLALMIAWVGWLFIDGSRGREGLLLGVRAVAGRFGLRYAGGIALKARGVVDRLPVEFEIERSPPRARWNPIKLRVEAPPGAVFVEGPIEHLVDEPPAAPPVLPSVTELFVHLDGGTFTVSAHAQPVPETALLLSWVEAWLAEARLRCTPRADVPARMAAAQRRAAGET